MAASSAEPARGDATGARGAAVELVLAPRVTAAWPRARALAQRQRYSISTSVPSGSRAICCAISPRSRMLAAASIAKRLLTL